MGDSANVDGGWRGEISGTVKERDLFGNPTKVQEAWTGREYERNSWGTFEPVKSQNDGNGIDTGSGDKK